jgi:hypothetical protein
MADTTNRNDGHLDLSLKRTIDAPRAYLRPRRAFHTIMRSPEGRDFPFQCPLAVRGDAARDVVAAL